jgi:predicted DNA repair protein MutK
MPGGLVALLDDVAALAKLAAASIDDVAGAAGRAGTKAAGVVIDDTAVTPRYVVGLSPDRELPIIWKIAIGSLRNKLLFILPVALALSSFAPWAITPLLMIGGSYLCFEAAEKIIHALTGSHDPEEVVAITDAAELEARQVSGAVRTDFILSAEIMAIALADLPELSLGTRAAALVAVAFVITAGVYGVVGLIVKMDDIGLHLSRRSSKASATVGRALVRGMPVLLKVLSDLGAAAMIWVGGGILLHGLEAFGLGALPHAVEGWAESLGRAAPAAHGVVAWIVGALGSAIVGLVVGGIIVGLFHLLKRNNAPVSANA